MWPSKHGVPGEVYTLLQEQDLWLPSTFDGIHTGLHDTWYAPGGCASARLDYAAIPASWTVHSRCSHVLLDFDTGHRSVDHFPVFLLTWAPKPQRGAAAKRQVALDRAKMATAEGQAAIRHICERAPLQPWETDADTHVRALQAYLSDEIAKAFPRAKHSKPGSFLSESTWVLRSHRIWLRRRIVSLRHRARSLGKLVAFRVWSLCRPWGAVWSCTSAKLCGMARKAQAFLQQLRASKSELRRLVRRDRRAWMHDIARQSEESSVKDVVQRLRPLEVIWAQTSV